MSLFAAFTINDISYMLRISKTPSWNNILLLSARVLVVSPSPACCIGTGLTARFTSLKHRRLPVIRGASWTCTKSQVSLPYARLDFLRLFERLSSQVATRCVFLTRPGPFAGKTVGTVLDQRLIVGRCASSCFNHCHPTSFIGEAKLPMSSNLNGAGIT